MILKFLNRRKLLVRYLFVGTISFGTDFTFYNFGLYLNFDPSISKSISFILGMVSAFTLNKYITFQTNELEHGKIKFIGVYISSLFMNVMTNDLILAKSSENLSLRYEIAFILSSGISIAINYVGTTKFVFKLEDRKDK